MTFAIQSEYREVSAPLAMRAAILRLQGAMAGHPNEIPIDDLPLKHTFAPGAYAREIFIPAGTLVVGKIHRHAHLNMLVRGHVKVATEEGMRELDATNEPITMVSAAGTKRAVLALTDTIWITIHLTDKTDLAEIEKEIIAPDYAALGLEDRSILQGAMQ